MKIFKSTNLHSQFNKNNVINKFIFIDHMYIQNFFQSFLNTKLTTKIIEKLWKYCYKSMNYLFKDLLEFFQLNLLMNISMNFVKFTKRSCKKQSKISIISLFVSSLNRQEMRWLEWVKYGHRPRALKWPFIELAVFVHRNDVIESK